MATFVEIKQNPDLSAQMLGLDKHGRSKFPGTFEILQPGKTPDNRWVTGLDEHAVSIKRIADRELREKRTEEVKELREELERLTGLDLSGTSAYWSTYFIKLMDKKALNFDNPNERVQYYVLLANKFSAPELEATSDPDYSHTKYYMHRTETEASQKAVKSRERDKATSDLYQLYENPAKLTLIAKFILGNKVKADMSKDGIYNMIGDALKTDKEGTVVRKFADAMSKTIEELQYKLIVDEAITRHVIRIREGYYQRGNATYGKTMKEVLKYLSSPENADEFSSVKEEVEEKRALG